MHADAGVAFSGGGIIALLASMCQMRALTQVLSAGAQPPLAATSGGIAGLVLHASAGGNLSFPPSWSPVDYGPKAHEALAHRYHSDGPWFGAVTDLLLGNHESAPLANGGGWWKALLGDIARLYGLNPTALHAPDRLTATLSLLRASSAPLQRDAAGVMRNVSGNLIPAEWRPTDGMLRPVGAGANVGPPAMPLASVIETLADATSFWAAPLVESPIAFALLRGALPRLPPPHDDFLLVDGLERSMEPEKPSWVPMSPA